MKEKIRENTKAIILILGIMLTIIGVTYSYLAPIISGVEKESTIAFNSGMIKITYSESNIIVAENIIPGWSSTKEFTVIGINNTSINDENIMDYAIKLVVEENTFTDCAIKFELTGTSTNEADTLSPLFGEVSTGEGETLVGTARFSQDNNIKSEVTHAYSLKISFPNDENKSQNENMNKTFKGYVIVEETELYIPILSNYIASLEKTESGKGYLRYDGTKDNNLRYFGPGTYADDVPNYVSFNNELWRIIGIFNVYNADTEETEKTVKIIRNESLENFSWDTSSSNTNEGWGVNAWNDADLMKELNGDYLNSYLTDNPTWYNGQKNNKTAKFNKDYAISRYYQRYVINARWYLGGWNSTSVSATDMYKYERNGEGSLKTISGETCSGEKCNDKVTRDDYTDNLIGLPYPSDFGFAAKNNGDNNCSSDMILSSNCSSTYNWMSTGNNYEWTITQFVHSSNARLVFVWQKYGELNAYAAASSDGEVRPCLYLKSSTLITGGKGTSTTPYQIKLS